MNEENFEEWDDDFMEKLIQVEELALSSCTQNVNLMQTQNQPPSSSYFPPPQNHQLLCPPPPRNDLFRYSPPRELSQRTSDSGAALTERAVNGVFAQCPAPSTPTRRATASNRAKDVEIDRLKKELGRVSKQLMEMEHECLELKKERNKEDKPVDSRNEAQVAQFQSLKTAREHEIPVAAQQGALQDSHNSNALDDNIGIQRAKSCRQAAAVQADLHTCLDLSKKLQGIWAPPSDYLGRSMVLKLFVDCATDFNVLFGFMSVDSSPKMVSHLVVKGSSDASKVSRLYSAMTEISDGMMPLETLLEPLFDLCRVENDVIAYRSLHILHVLLKHLLTFERKSKGRENVMVEELDSRSNIKQFLDGDEASYATCIPASIRFSEEETICRKGHGNNESSMPFSSINWISLFELMSTIALKSCEESVRLEAVSIMNVILMRSDAYTEREKFGQILVFETISQLLKKEVGLHVQKETVQLLYLLLNYLPVPVLLFINSCIRFSCNEDSKLLATFCSGCSGGESVSAANDNDQSNSSFKVFRMILEGLADCIACCGNGVVDLELQRNAIILLAFIASSGKSGFNILVNHQLSREATFLLLILQLIVSEIDTEATVYTESDETFRARTLLMREVLILLNRLVSNPLHSATFLRALTINRDMASLTIDLATRLSKKEHNPVWSNSMFKQMRESEIVDLARVFKKRVFAYLGDNIH